MDKKGILIAPSILSADFSKLGEEVGKVEKAGADWIHVDVMDGQFVPNITIGPLAVSALSKATKLPLDVHLMIERPEKYISKFAESGASIITVHSEACRDIKGLIKNIKSLGVKAGVSIKPKTPVSDILPVMDMLDLVLVMTVEPGFGGQKLIPDTIAKIEELKKHITENNLSCHIEVDGGINTKTGPAVVRAGATVLVAGNAIFSSSDPAFAVQEIKNSL